MNAPIDGIEDWSSRMDEESGSQTRKEFLKRGAVAGAVLLTASDLKVFGGISQARAAAAARIAASKAHITLLNWHTDTPKVGLGEGYFAAGRLYEKTFPGSTVTFQAEPYGTYVPFVTSAFRAGKLPSNAAFQPGLLFSALFPATRPFSPSAVKPASLLKTLSGWLGTELNVGRNQTYVGFPVFGQGLCWYYNKAMFQAAGLDPNKPPQTFAQFAQACNALKAKGMVPFSTAGQDGSTASLMLQSWLPQFFPTTKSISAFATGQTTFNQPGVVAVMNAMRETYTQGWWQPNYQSLSLTDTTADFGSGKVAMALGALTDILNWAIWDKSSLGKNGYGVFVAPLLPGAKVKISPFYFAPAILLATTQRAKNPAASMAFNEFLASAPAQETVLKNGGTWPNRADVNVLRATNSPGADAINKLIQKHGTQGNFATYFNTAAGQYSGPNITGAIVSGNIQGFIDQMVTLQG